MRIAEMNWMQVEDYLKHDDRAVLPLGSTEQHAYLSLATDSILAERVAVEAAEPLGVPVFPAVPYGLTPYFGAYPGSITLRLETYARLLRDILDSLHASGFRRIVLVNGHGGNSPADAFAAEWMMDHPQGRVKLYNWWNAPQTWAKVQEIDAAASHASWMENFPWTRLPGVGMPAARKSAPSRVGKARLAGAELRACYGDGNFGGLYARADDDMLAIWQVAVAETQQTIVGGWD
jgi:creatinine amidohydrolase